MASIVLPKAQNCSLTWDAAPLPDLADQSVRLITETPWFPAVPDSGPGRQFVEGIPTHRLAISGYVRKSGGGAFGKTQAATTAFTPTGLTIHNGLWRVGKRWSLVDVTDGAEKAWHWRRPQVFGSFSAIAKATGPKYDTLSGALSMVLDQVGTVSGTARYPSGGLGFSKVAGGEVGVNGQFLFDGAVTYTAATDIDWKFADTTADPPTGEATIDLDTGETITHKVMIYSWLLECSLASGGPIRATALGVFDEAAA